MCEGESGGWEGEQEGEAVVRHAAARGGGERAALREEEEEDIHNELKTFPAELFRGVIIAFATGGRAAEGGVGGVNMSSLSAEGCKAEERLKAGQADNSERREAADQGGVGGVGVKEGD